MCSLASFGAMIVLQEVGWMAWQESLLCVHLSVSSLQEVPVVLVLVCIFSIPTSDFSELCIPQQMLKYQGVIPWYLSTLLTCLHLLVFACITDFNAWLYDWRPSHFTEASATVHFVLMGCAHVMLSTPFTQSMFHFTEPFLRDSECSCKLKSPCKWVYCGAVRLTWHWHVFHCFAIPHASSVCEQA